MTQTEIDTIIRNHILSVVPGARELITRYGYNPATVTSAQYAEITRLEHLRELARLIDEDGNCNQLGVTDVKKCFELRAWLDSQLGHEQS